MNKQQALVAVSSINIEDLEDNKKVDACKTLTHMHQPLTKQSSTSMQATVFSIH